MNLCAQKNDCYRKIIEDNTTLIKEMDKLRRELEINREKYDKLETTFNVKRYKTSKTSRRAKINQNDNSHISMVCVDTAVDNYTRNVLH